MRDIAAATAEGNYDLAARHADAILVLGYQHPSAYYARALAFQQRRKFRDALIELNKARQLAPRDTTLSNAVGVCLINLNQAPEAIAAFDQTIALDPGNARAHSHKAWVLEMLDEREKATEAYERAIAIDPEFVDALAGLAAILAGEGKFEAAGQLARRALAIDPAQPGATTALGVIDLANREYANAEHRFRNVLDGGRLAPNTRATVSGLLADALDGQERVDEAFAFYKLKNETLHQIYAAGVTEGRRPRQVTERICAFVAASSGEDWKRESSVDAGRGPARHHIFLIGFLRSGTTLLEQVLATHPDVAALEEKDVLAGAAQSFLCADAGLRSLIDLGDAELESLRNAYWQRVRELGPRIEGKTFVDKLPLNTMKLPLIAKLFPHARILFALRDPRDVILSCFRRHFEINAAAFEFLNLEDCASLYDSVMRLAQACREKLPLDVHVHRYEDMVDDFDKTVREICQFIGVEWTESLRNFSQTKVLRVFTPSGPQIRRPLNADSIGRWRAYRTHLAPVLPRLAPWVAQFGYQKD